MATMKTLNGYGFNATELNGKTSDSYLLKTDTVANSADSQKLGGKAPKYYIQPRNLLDNSDFRNPVNQRNVSSWKNGYGIDRWLMWEGTATKNDVGVLISSADGNPNIQQRLEKGALDNTKTYTVAICDSYGNVTFGEIGHNDTMWYVTFFVQVGKTYVWAALYEGSYTADTLPPYVPKGYAAELAECQRYYYQSFSESSSTMTSGMTVCEAITTSRATNVFFPQTMRIDKPTVTVYSPFSGNVDKASEYVSNTEVDATAGHRSRHRFMLQSGSSAFEIGKHYGIHYTVSADL